MMEITFESVSLDPGDHSPNSQTFILRRMPFVIGRHAGCNWPLDHPYISRLHSCLFCRDGEVYLQDCGSLNGTFLNGERVCEPIPVRSGDLVCFGFHMFRTTVVPVAQERPVRSRSRVPAMAC